jgi:hypothetical protein
MLRGARTGRFSRVTSFTAARTRPTRLSSAASIERRRRAVIARSLPAPESADRPTCPLAPRPPSQGSQAQPVFQTVQSGDGAPLLHASSLELGGTKLDHRKRGDNGTRWVEHRAAYVQLYSSLHCPRPRLMQVKKCSLCERSERTSLAWTSLRRHDQRAQWRPDDGSARIGSEPGLLRADHLRRQSESASGARPIAASTRGERSGANRGKG